MIGCVNTELSLSPITRTPSFVAYTSEEAASVRADHPRTQSDARILTRRQIGHQVSGSHSFVGLRMALHLFDAARSSRPHPERIQHRGNQRRARESEQRPTAVDVDRDSERDDDAAPGV